MTSSRRGSFIPGLIVGVLAGLAAAALLDPFGDGSKSLSAEAVEVIESNYFRDPGLRRLENGSVQGMIEVLRKRHEDRFSHYFDPEMLEDFEAATSGEFSGVGMAVSEVKRGLRVARVYPDTPAKQAGIAAEDVIVAVDGKSIAGMDAEAAAAMIKGPPGTDVSLRVARPGGGMRKLTVERAEVRIPAVRGELRRSGGKKIAYVELATFSEGAHGELREEVERLYRRGAGGLVLDLRGNGGGLLNEAVLSASVFVESGTIVSTEGRTQAPKDYRAVGDALEPRPTAVLINADTASAAEILAAALRDYEIAELVGTKSFGKGTFQEIIGLENGGALDLTVGEYVTSEGESLAGKGVRPGVRIADDPDTKRDEAVRKGLGVVAGEL